MLAIRKISYHPYDYFAFEAGAVSLGSLVILLASVSLKPALRISPIPKTGAPLVARGIYRFVRHPMYLGVILIGFGLAGFSNSGYSWVVEFILVVNLNVKARFEDAFLREIHPESFHYQTHTSRIIPCVGGSCRDNCGM